jgi:hypothetical protein
MGRTSIAMLEVRRERFLKRLQAHEVHVPWIDPAELRRRAIERSNSRGNDWIDPAAAVAPAIMAWLQVLYLRDQESTGYGKLLEMADRQGVTWSVGAAIRRKVHGAIARAHPELAEACDR